MIKLTNKFYGASLIALAFLLNASDVNAETCTTAPSCEVLGFTKSTTDCRDRTSLKCPFDQSKFFCLTAKEEEEALGGSGGEPGDCAVGAILYSDKTFSTELISGKTPIGVVFDVERRLAVGLASVKLALIDSRQCCQDIPNLPNLTIAAEDYSGKTNTATIKAFCEENDISCPAVEYIANYSTNGTAAGDWYIPAMGELIAIRDNRDALNITLAKITSAKKIETDWIISSSEQDDRYMWALLGKNESTTTKYYPYGIILPVLAF